MSAAVDVSIAAEGTVDGGAHSSQVLVSQHPVLQHKLALIRRQEGTAKDFRTLFREITFYLGYEATATLTTKPICVKTDRTDQVPARKISQTVAVVPILRQVAPRPPSALRTSSLMTLAPFICVQRVHLEKNQTAFPQRSIPVLLRRLYIFCLWGKHCFPAPCGLSPSPGDIKRFVPFFLASFPKWRCEIKRKLHCLFFPQRRAGHDRGASRAPAGFPGLPCGHVP
ncbi:unnamed protein product [Scytosiphon promiscuus]